MNFRPLLCASLALFPFAISAQTDTAYCTAPGELVSEDATGDAPGPIPADTGLDVLSVHIAEPFGDGADTLHFTLKINRNAQGATPQTRYYVNFITSDGVERFVRYTPYPIPGAENAFSGADQMFSVGHIEDGSSVTDAPAEGESSADADGNITIVAKARTLALRPGDVITDIEGESAIYNIGGRVPVDTSNALGVYEVRGNASCEGKSAEAKQGSSLLAGAFAPGLLLMLAGVAALRRRG